MTAHESRLNRLLHGHLSEEAVHKEMTALGLTEPEAAHRRLQRIAAALPDEAAGKQPRASAAFLQSLVSGLADAAHPDRVLTHLERFVNALADRPEVLRACTADRRGAEMLVTLFAGSQFLGEQLLVHPEYFEHLVQAQSETRRLRRLEQQRTEAEMFQAARAALAGVEGFDEQADALRRFQRREMLRIGACDLLGLWDLPVVTEQLSHLADSLVRASLEIAAQETGTVPAGFVVVALGKLGGQELNYSSDIDLLFLATSKPATYDSLAIKLMDALRAVTTEGFLYRVDMRLRPWGRVGPLVSSLEGYLNYLKKNARLWEKQALLKARFIAGHTFVGEQFLQSIQPFLFSVDASTVRADVYEMKGKIEAELRKRGRDWGEVKLGKGSIRDVEFVTQYLQLVHGAEHPQVRSPQTLDALNRLYDAALLPQHEYRVLTDGYVFLRAVEHDLQLMHYRQTHTLPQGDAELFHLARRLGFRGVAAKDQFVAQYEQHSQAIRTVYRRYLEPTVPGEDASTGVTPHLRQLTPVYALIFDERAIEHHATLAERLGQDNLVEVDAAPLPDDYWRMTVVGYDYLGAFSAICGLLLVYGFNIHDGHVFTYEARPEPVPDAAAGTARRARGVRKPKKKIIDVLTVRSMEPDVPPERWVEYKAELQELMQLLHAGEREAAQGRLARRVASTMPLKEAVPPKLYPVDITIDNTTSERYTVLRIDAPDTMGFLYELTNALSLNRLDIARMSVDSVKDRVRDTLYVTDAQGHKLTDPERQRQLRAAIVLVKHFTHLLPSAPDPESALLHFRAFLAKLFRRPDWTVDMASLERPDVLDALTRLLGVSDFLWEDFLRMQHENLFPVLSDTDALTQVKTKDQLRDELDARLNEASTPAARRKALNAYKDREMFRIDMRYILEGTGGFDAFSAELSDLAEVVVAAAVRLCRSNLEAQYGTPHLETGEPCALSVCALGKAGGRELGFASDIELLYVYAGPGETSGPKVVTNAVFFDRVVQAVTETIRARREGIFEIDLRLRPYGRAGSMAVSVQAFDRYFAADGPAWPYERQLLVKLRPIAGDPDLGRYLQTARDEIIDGSSPFDVAAMRAMRERQVRHLVTPGTINAKYSLGGLVDVEYLIQGLQITYSRRYPSLHGLTNTQEALQALADVGMLSAQDHADLAAALQFLRRLIEALRMVHGHAKDLTLPSTDSTAFAFLARRLGYDHPAPLEHDLTHHMGLVQKLNTKLLV